MLQTVNPAKATGSDGIPGLVLKKCAATLAAPLASIINTSLETGMVPLSFKLSHISPLYKSGDPSSACNYRPVSLLPIISRTLEHFIKQQLTAFLTEHDLYPETQFAYRRYHSTEDALVYAVNRWLLARSKHCYTGIAFLDMSKAFDRVQHQRLIEELHSLGISAIPLQWFCSYLSNRHQQVKINDNLSSAVPCSRGVPQGSVLGPLLFVLYTRKLRSILSTSITHQEFADDIVVDHSNRDLSVVCTELSKAVTAASEWLTEIGLLLNTKKTQIMVIQPRGISIDVPNVYCGSSKLDLTPAAKYLGVYIDSELSWRPHIDHIARRTAQTIGQLWRHGRSLTLAARRTWLLSMICGQLSYASTAFFPSLSAAQLDRLVKIFKSAIRAVFRLPQTTPSAPLLSRLHLSPLLQQYQLKLIVFIHRCLGSNGSRLFDPYFYYLNQDRVTRGQNSRLLAVPFLQGLAGRSSIHFVGSVYWNSLPSSIRSQTTLYSFKNAITSEMLNALSLSLN